MGRLELPRVSPLEPKSSAYTNFATFASLCPELDQNFDYRRSGMTSAKKKARGDRAFLFFGGPSPARTGDLLIKSQLLYQLS